MKIMLIFFVASNRKIGPPDFAQTQSYVSRLYPPLHPHNLLKEIIVNH